MKDTNTILKLEAVRAAAFHAAGDIEENTAESRARAAALLYLIEDTLEELSKEA